MNINEEMLDKKIVFFSIEDKFTWASGIKSPIYCDNRMILSYPRLREFVAKSLASNISEKFKDVEIIMGTATAGIPHATLVGHEMELPCGYVRSSSKAHGRQNQIEGADVKGKKVVVVEDLISTGGSVMEVVDSLKENGADVLGVIAIFSYNLDKATNLFKEKNVDLDTLTNINSLLEYIDSKGYLTKEEIEVVNDFLEQLNEN